MFIFIEGLPSDVLAIEASGCREPFWPKNAFSGKSMT